MGEIDQPPQSLPGEAMVCQLKELPAFNYKTPLPPSKPQRMK
jgi:hypothetical protein